MYWKITLDGWGILKWPHVVHFGWPSGNFSKDLPIRILRSGASTNLPAFHGMSLSATITVPGTLGSTPRKSQICARSGCTWLIYDGEEHSWRY